MLFFRGRGVGKRAAVVSYYEVSFGAVSGFGLGRVNRQVSPGKSCGVARGNGDGGQSLSLACFVVP